jgi:hypothetical protein
MQEVTVEKDKLIEILQENRSRHRELFEEAYEAYGKKVVKNLEATLQAAKNGKPQEVNLTFNLVRPQDHTADYDRALEMLDLEVEDTVVLQQHEFSELVQDDWGWKGQFSAHYASNTGKVI